MLKRISPADTTPVRVVIVTLDSHLAQPVARAEAALRAEVPGLSISLHAAAEWASDPQALLDCKAAIAEANVIIATMLFLDEHIQAVLPDLQARRDAADVFVGCMAAGEVIKLTRMGRFNMGAKESGAIALLKRLRGSGKKKVSSGAHQMRMLKRIPKILKWIPGTAQDVRAYFLAMQYWMAGSDDNIAALVRYLLDRYADGERAALQGKLNAPAPVAYPETGLYHPRLPGRRVTEAVSDLPLPHADAFAEEAATFVPQDGDPLSTDSARPPTVGVLLMRAYVLAGDTAHYDGVIAALEAKGLRVIPAFAAGLDARPAIDAFFKDTEGRLVIDALVSLTGFSLVGGPAYNDTQAAEEALAELDVPYTAAHALEFQNLEEWREGGRGLSPIEATMMVAIPEIDGATGPIVYGGRSRVEGDTRAMRVEPERAQRLADRVTKQIALRRTPANDRKVAVVLYGFPPNAGAVGTAAHLSVFESLWHTLIAMRAEGYQVDVPETVDGLRDAILKGNAEQFGQQANVAAQIPADDIVQREPHLDEIEAAWGPAPGKAQSDGRHVFVLGKRLGNVLVAVQPAFGYEGDPMRLLFEKGFAPTHAFSTFYRYLREDFGAHVALHFGMHGATEFMPGKQVGLGPTCWPDRLMGDLPSVYLYAMNNPSEGALAKRRGNAVTVTHLTPPIAKAGLYKGLIDLRASLDRWRGTDPTAADRADLAELIRAQAQELDFEIADRPDGIDTLWQDLIEYEQALIPHGLHVVGRPVSPAAQADILATMAEALPEHDLTEAAEHLTRDTETPALLHALQGGFVRPVPGADLIRAPQALPTGRNLHAFDPFRMPSGFAMSDGQRQAEVLLQRHLDEGNSLPRSVALVLWGADNLKTEGGPIAQAMALMGARPRFDSYGRLCGAELLPLEELGRPRIDVVMTLSGIFRDLLPLQTKMLAEAAWLAAKADEPVDRNHVRANTETHAAENDMDFETAALRVFSNADGAYGSNVNQLVDSGAWGDEDELADMFQKRKCFAYGRTGDPAAQPELMQAVLSKVDLAYQNLESVELGVTTIDHYFDTLGGISRAVTRASGKDAPVYISDQTRGDGKVRTLSEQVALETRTRALNPKWYEGMLEHGHEGVRQIEAHVTNSVGWSATTGQVDPWVYQRLTETFVLDPEMRRRLSELNPQASARMANRLIEAQERAYWNPDDETLAALRAAGDELEDRLEGISPDVAAE
ncbi:MAG: magnesium chelatase subunit H [Pseudomonadota bacterium]